MTRGGARVRAGEARASYRGQGEARVRRGGARARAREARASYRGQGEARPRREGARVELHPPRASRLAPQGTPAARREARGQRLTLEERPAYRG
eukprot:scaffold34755_cov45-Phaeocystis_antarctica.AAC.3